MKKLTSIALVLCLVAMSTVAFGQADPGDVGVFFDNGGTATTACWPSFTQTNHFYVVAFDTGGIAGYEVGLTIDPTVIIFNSMMVAGAGPINVGSAPDNWIVGTGNCVNGAGAVALLDFTAGYFVAGPTDLTICLTPTSPSSFNPAVPGWLECDDSLTPFGVAASGGPDYPDGCGVLCPTGQDPVGTEQASWGSLKSTF